MFTQGIIARANEGIPMTTPAPILQLPVDILRLIYAQLSLDGKASFVMSCKTLYSTLGTSAFAEWDERPLKYEVRVAKSYFLRGLERDRRDPTIYVCHNSNCLRFHDINYQATPEPRNPRERLFATDTDRQVGFPHCQSEHPGFIRDIYAALQKPRFGQKGQAFWGTKSRSPVAMEYSYITWFRDRDLFLRRTYKLMARGEDVDHFMVPFSFLTTANLEICRHVYFERACVRGPGSLNEALDKHYRRQHADYNAALPAEGEIWKPELFSGFLCQDCRLEVGIEFVGSTVIITVWQHMGACKEETKMTFVPKVFKKATFEDEIARNGGLRAGDLPAEFRRGYAISGLS